MRDNMLCPKDKTVFTALKELTVWLASQTNKQSIVLHGQAHTTAFDSQSTAPGLRYYETKLDM